MTKGSNASPPKARAAQFPHHAMLEEARRLRAALAAIVHIGPMTVLLVPGW